jgi:hypothetical protein
MGKGIFTSPRATVHECITSTRRGKWRGKITIKKRGDAHLQSLSPRMQTVGATPAPLEKEHMREKEWARWCAAGVACSSQRRSFARAEQPDAERLALADDAHLTLVLAHILAITSLASPTETGPAPSATAADWKGGDDGAPRAKSTGRIVPHQLAARGPLAGFGRCSSGELEIEGRWRRPGEKTREQRRWRGEQRGRVDLGAVEASPTRWPMDRASPAGSLPLPVGITSIWRGGGGVHGPLA